MIVGETGDARDDREMSTTMAERVVVAVDGGSASTSALDWAIDRARSVDMRLEIITVVDVDWLPQSGAETVVLEHERTVQDAARRV
ncbi:universal stress protein, partial [Pasteurella multocida]|uniref:universal stress protein n=1 Tax=Pasteurella multocida TaxID=747 RepID=UPI002ECD08FC|nr:universal stress protein [Pasteurella multocida]